VKTGMLTTISGLKKMLVIMLKKACMYINSIYILEIFRHDELHDAIYNKER